MDIGYLQRIGMSSSNPDVPNYSTITPQMSFPMEHQAPLDNGVANGINTPVGKLPTEFNDTIFRSTTKQVLPLVGIPDAVLFADGGQSLTAYMYPVQGYARGQDKGLATDPNKPMDGRVMPLAGFYNPNELNVLGSVPP